LPAGLPAEGGQSGVVTVLCQGEEIFHSTLPPDTGGLIWRLNGFQASEVHVVYETGPTGYWLHQALVEIGAAKM